MSDLVDVLQKLAAVPPAEDDGWRTTAELAVDMGWSPIEESSRKRIHKMLHPGIVSGAIEQDKRRRPNLIGGTSTLKPAFRVKR